MELWNLKKLDPPPTYRCKIKAGQIDTDHLGTIIRDSISFYEDQYLFNLEVSMLSRIIYRMKTKFRNSKDFNTLEKVKKNAISFNQINILKHLENFNTLLPSNNYEDDILVPSKNMVDYLLVRLQSIGTILCRIVEMCKLTGKLYEARLRLGHFWKLALIAIGLVSRIHIISLYNIKFTCLLYLRLLPLSHKLKNPGTDWLPKDYIFPKDLQDWLKIEWAEFEDIVEIPDLEDEEDDMPFLDLVDDSDDDVEFCDEYIQIKDDLDIINDYKNLRKMKPINIEKSVKILRGFTSNIDTGEVISEENGEAENDHIVEEDSLKNSNLTEVISSDEDSCDIPYKTQILISSSGEDSDDDNGKSVPVKENSFITEDFIPSNSNTINLEARDDNKNISNDLDDSVQIIGKIVKPIQHTFETTAFIPLESSFGNNKMKIEKKKKEKSKKSERNINGFKENSIPINLDDSVVVIKDVSRPIRNCFETEDAIPNVQNKKKKKNKKNKKPVGDRNNVEINHNKFNNRLTANNNNSNCNINPKKRKRFHSVSKSKSKSHGKSDTLKSPKKKMRLENTSDKRPIINTVKRIKRENTTDIKPIISTVSNKANSKIKKEKQIKIEVKREIC